MSPEMKPFIPDRASDAGPDRKESPLSWRDHLDFAGDHIRKADRAESEEGRIPEQRNVKRLLNIEYAIQELHAAKELLCR